MILVLLALLVNAILFHLPISADASLIALAIGLVADATRSNRITQADAAKAALKAYAESLVRAKGAGI